MKQQQWEIKCVNLYLMPTEKCFVSHCVYRHDCICMWICWHFFFDFVYSNQEFNSRACCKAKYQLLKPTDVHTTKPNVYARIVNSYCKRLDFNTSMDRIYSKIETCEQTSYILVVGLVCFISFYFFLSSFLWFFFLFICLVKFVEKSYV